MLYIVLGILLIISIFWLFKVPRVGQMVLITGGIKTGKTTLSVRLAIKKYKKNKRLYYIKKFIGKIIRKKLVADEPPLLYSNIPLRVPYVPITNELLERKHRFVYGSVVYLCETSLIADSMTFKDGLLNERLLLFVKLFAHELCNNGGGGLLVLDTQSISDNHYAIKRCLNTYLHIYQTINIPLVPFLVVKYQELFYSEDGNNVNVRTEDVSDNLHWCLVPKSTWKKFDRYCYSILTDHLPVERSIITKTKKEKLKIDYITTFKTYKTLETRFIKTNEK